MPRSSTSMRRTAGVGRLLRLAGIIALLMTAAAPTVSAYPVDPNWAPPRTVFIPETGHTIDGLFLDLWRSGGGALSYGNPVTAEITEPEGQIIQYYEYARFEYWPEGDENGNFVTLGEIGQELGAPVLMRRFALRGTAVPSEDLTVARAWLPRSDVDASVMAA
ncbi:MAG: hypothetical protein ACRDJC_27110, partial [Thermomicrobiales bacterium]